MLPAKHAIMPTAKPFVKKLAAIGKKIPINGKRKIEKTISAIKKRIINALRNTKNPIQKWEPNLIERHGKNGRGNGLLKKAGDLLKKKVFHFFFRGDGGKKKGPGPAPLPGC